MQSYPEPFPLDSKTTCPYLVLVYSELGIFLWFWRQFRVIYKTIVILLHILKLQAERTQKKGGMVMCATVLVILCFIMIVLLILKEILFWSYHRTVLTAAYNVYLDQQTAVDVPKDDLYRNYKITLVVTSCGRFVCNFALLFVLRKFVLSRFSNRCYNFYCRLPFTLVKWVLLVTILCANFSN